MKIEESIKILKQHNRWRRGADIPMTEPKIIGEAIDCVVDYFADVSKIVWHKVAEGDLPEDGQHILMAHRMRNGDYCIEAIWYPEPPATNDMEYWMEIPEININEDAVNDTYDAEYLQSKIDAHTKRMQENGLTSDKMLEECRGGDLLTWQDIRRIVKIADEMIDEDVKGNLDYLDTEEEYYMEILRRFKDE